jgi:hypothetical protein
MTVGKSDRRSAAANATGRPELPVLQTIEPAVGDDWPAHGLGPVSEIVRQLPDPADLPPGARIAVGTGMTEQRGLLSRLFSGSTPRAKVHLAVRCTALIVRGYTAVSADAAGTAYGLVPP